MDSEVSINLKNVTTDSEVFDPGLRGFRPRILRFCTTEMDLRYASASKNIWLWIGFRSVSRWKTILLSWDSLSPLPRERCRVNRGNGWRSDIRGSKIPFIPRTTPSPLSMDIHWILPKRHRIACIDPKYSFQTCVGWFCAAYYTLMGCYRSEGGRQGAVLLKSWALTQHPDP